LSRKLTMHVAGEEPSERVFDRRPNDVYLDQAAAFLSAISGSVPQRLATGEDGLRALQVSDAWRRSSTSGSRERTSTS
jgi:predicted dehydrogenase